MENSHQTIKMTNNFLLNQLLELRLPLETAAPAVHGDLQRSYIRLTRCIR